MYAIVRDRGMQYRVARGQVIDIALLEHAEAGTDFAFDEVLLISDPDEDGVKVGNPCIEGAKVRARVLGNVRGKKIVVFRYRRRKRYRRRTGHRQDYTRVRIEEILA